MKKIFIAFAMIGALTACQEKTVPASNLDTWTGQWNGPEGTYLVLTKNNTGYDIKIRDLDGEKTYQGKVAANLIQFDRNGKGETITAGNGIDTGMKWLADKKDCLVIQTGEGYCRD